MIFKLLSKFKNSHDKQTIIIQFKMEEKLFEV